MVDGFHLLRPELLWGLLACPIFALALWYRRVNQGDWTRVIDPELLQHLIPQDTREAERNSVWFPVVLSAMVIFAAAGPSLQKVELPVIKRADALVIVLDLSASMLAADIQPSRVQRAGQKILDLLDTRKEGVTGLVVFAGDAHVVTPLTDDIRTIANLIPALSPTIMPLPGADATSAIELAAELLITAGAQGGQLLLMTDGLPNFDTGRAQAALADSGARLAMLAIGTPSGAPIPLPNGGFLKDDSGEIVIPVLDERALQTIATELEAPYREISLDESDIEALTEGDLLASEGELDLDRQTDAWQDQGYWLAALVALLLLPAFRKGVVACLALVFTLQAAPPEAAEWGDLWLTPDQQAADALADGDAQTAASKFSRSDWRGIAEYEAGLYDQAAASFANTPTADTLYNRGNALALQGDLKGALAAYEQSLALAPDAEDAIANRDFIQSLLDQESQNPEDQQGDEQNEDDASDDSSESQSESQDGSNSSDEQSSEQQDQSGDQEDSSGDQQPQDSQEEQQNQQDPTSTEEQRLSDEALEAATQEQMAKFDEALEEQQALEQWLRRVPDDPGGLLRRKFRYQSMQRLREGEEPDESIRW